MVCYSNNFRERQVSTINLPSSRKDRQPSLRLGPVSVRDRYQARTSKPSMSSTIADVRRLPAGRLFNPQHRSFTTTVTANSGSPPEQKAKSTRSCRSDQQDRNGCFPVPNGHSCLPPLACFSVLNRSYSEDAVRGCRHPPANTIVRVITTLQRTEASAANDRYPRRW